jgi:excisionase family DNA binding protein
MSAVEVFGLYGQLNLDIYTLEDLALRFGVTKNYFRNLVREGKIKAVDLGGPAGFRIRREWVIEWLDANAGGEVRVTGFSGKSPEEMEAARAAQSERMRIARAAKVS